jgi:hypothetical protein
MSKFFVILRKLLATEVDLGIKLLKHHEQLLVVQVDLGRFEDVVVNHKSLQIKIVSAEAIDSKTRCQSD